MAAGKQADGLKGDAALPTTLGRYRLDRTIGQGTYGKVKIAFDVITNEKVAVKIIDKQNIENERQVKRIQKEIRFLKLLNHPNIVKVYDVIETETHIFIVMEYAAGGELFDYIVAHKRVKEKEARVFFRQILSAVDYCHQNSVIHRDLKPENLLLDENKQIKIIDFGFSNTFQFNDLLNTFCGSPFYAAPEMILGKRYEGPEVDMWSLGVILFALLCGHLPFDDEDVKELYRKISTATYTTPPYISPDAKHLISLMITVNPKKRATIDEVKRHRWVNEGFDGPPPNHIPARPPLDPNNLDLDVVEKLRTFGYTDEDLAAKLTPTAEVNPIKSTYYLFQEYYAREDARPKQPKLESQHYKSRSIDNSLSAISEDAEVEMPSPRATSPTPAVPTPSGRRYSKILDDLDRPSEAMPPRVRRFSTSAAARPDFASTPALATVAEVAAAEVIKTRSATSMASTTTTSTQRSAPESSAPAGAEAPSEGYQRRRRLSLPAIEYTKKRSNNPSVRDARESGQMRTINGWFSVATTSSKPVPAIIAEIERVLTASDLAFEREGNFVFVCEDAAQKCAFEVEICQVTRMSLHGLHLKRLRGSIWTYKKVCGKLLSQLNL